jgi:hypothetical protein
LAGIELLLQSRSGPAGCVRAKEDGSVLIFLLIGAPHLLRTIKTECVVAADIGKIFINKIYVIISLTPCNIRVYFMERGDIMKTTTLLDFNREYKDNDMSGSAEIVKYPGGINCPFCRA